MPRTHTSAAILGIGDELILGQTLDTNSQWIASALADLGILVREIATLPDRLDQIRSRILQWSDSFDLVIITGGLGPTQDDLTRQALAEALDQPLITDEGALAEIRSRFQSANMDMPESNAIQACHPKSAKLLPNSLGTAPGLHAERHDADIFCLPGPPNEMHPMFTEHVMPILHPSRLVMTRLVRTVGITESAVADRLGDLMDRNRNPLVGTTASTSSITCRIRYEGQSQALGERLLDETLDDIRTALGPYIFAVGAQTLPGVVVDLLRHNAMRLATVESCTGGLIAKLITDIPGSSDVFIGGWTTYTNTFKSSQVGVDPKVIAEHGAVSEQCCRQMAEGGLGASNADSALAITGIAGPGGGSPDKPVGTVWIGLARTGTPTQTRLFRFIGDRDAIRQRAAMTALAMLRLSLIEAPPSPLACEITG